MFSRYFSYIVLVLALSGCTTSVEDAGQPLAQMTFDHVNAYTLDVASYDISFNNNQKALPAGFSVDPLPLVEDFLKRRFIASGSLGKMHAVIENIDVRYEEVKSDNALNAALGVGKQDHYLVHLQLALESYGLKVQDNKRVAISVNRNIYISEHSSLATREDAQMRALDSMMEDLDGAVREILKTQFGVLN